MIYLIDTCILIDHLRGYQPARDWLMENIAEKADNVYISVITVTELLARAPLQQEKLLSHLFSVMECIGIDESATRIAGEYLQKWRRTIGLEVPDALIAATAKQHGLALVTLNRRHFPMEDLEIVIPYTYS